MPVQLPEAGRQEALAQGGAGSPKSPSGEVSSREYCTTLLQMLKVTKSPLSCRGALESFTVKQVGWICHLSQRRVLGSSFESNVQLIRFYSISKTFWPQKSHSCPATLSAMCDEKGLSKVDDGRQGQGQC